MAKKGDTQAGSDTGEQRPAPDKAEARQLAAEEEEVRSQEDAADAEEASQEVDEELRAEVLQALAVEQEARRLSEEAEAAQRYWQDQDLTGVGNDP